MGYEWVTRVSKLYELQELYQSSQGALVDRIGGLGELDVEGPDEMISAILGRLRVVVGIQDDLMAEFETFLREQGG